jgi:drug/metabolite transporter (DMT)-like permease
VKKLIILLGVLGASLSAIFVRLADAPSLVLVLYRVLFATILLTPVVLLRHRDEFIQLQRKPLLLAMLSGVFLGLHFSFYFESLRWTSIAAAVVLTDTEVFFVALAMFVVLKEKITKRGWIGIAITFIGGVLIALADSGNGRDALRGDLLAVSAAFCVAVYTLIGRYCRRTMSTFVYTFVVYAASSLTVMILLLIQGTPLLGYTTVNFLSGLGLAVFCTLLGHSVFSWGLKYEKASFVSVAKLMEPVFASLMGLILFAEIPALLVIIGGATIIMGIAVQVKGETRAKLGGEG